jgi:hypothetical protein
MVRAGGRVFFRSMDLNLPRWRVVRKRARAAVAFQYHQLAALDALLAGLSEHGIVVARRQRGLGALQGDSAAPCTSGAIFLSMIF